ncbi:MAG: biotin/lipoyl-containing protein [Bacteroidota bacterium]|nr:biotin/lipoyl-containing protein [Bacteroidota bacterium]
MATYSVNIDGDNTLDIKWVKGAWYVNDAVAEVDVLKISDTRFHIIYKNKSYNVNISPNSESVKAMTVSVNGKSAEISIKDETDILMHDLGLDALNANAVKDIKAPMPGLVLKIMVTEGQTVEKDTPLLILEAMKMENMIKATNSATVKSIKVNEKDAVEKNQLLIQFGINN